MFYHPELEKLCLDFKISCRSMFPANILHSTYFDLHTMCIALLLFLFMSVVSQLIVNTKVITEIVTTEFIY